MYIYTYLAMTKDLIEISTEIERRGRKVGEKVDQKTHYLELVYQI